jgi:hypothetical protein
MLMPSPTMFVFSEFSCCHRVVFSLPPTSLARLPFRANQCRIRRSVKVTSANLKSAALPNVRLLSAREYSCATGEELRPKIPDYKDERWGVKSGVRFRNLDILHKKVPKILFCQRQ